MPKNHLKMEMITIHYNRHFTRLKNYDYSQVHVGAGVEPCPYI